MNMKRLTIQTNRGRYNLMSDEESISCRIAIYDNEELIHGTSLTLDYESDWRCPDVSEAIELLEECVKKMFIDTSRSKKEEMIRFLRENEEEIDKGTRKHRIEVLKKKREQIDSEIASLQSLL